MGRIAATYDWPFAEDLRAANTALIVIDMQVDFCAAGGWIDQLGESVANTAAVIAPAARLLAGARRAGLTIIHTREGHRPDLSDLPAHKQWRTRAHGLGIGDTGANGRILVRGERGHGLVPECAALPGEIVIDKPGKGAFMATNLDRVLRERGIAHLIIAGVTSDCCVQSTLRDAADRGYDALLVRDATAAVERHHHDGMLAVLAAHGGRWGAVAELAPVLHALDRLP